MSAHPLRYLTAEDVRAAMPPVDERIELARRTMIALVADADLPPKLGVHPRQPASLAHAMPALLRGSSAGGEDDLLGLKWVTAFPENSALGIPAVNATVLLNDATTGVPMAIMDGGPITAQRTAAVSGVALRQWWPSLAGTVSLTLVGAGVQGESHLEVLADVAQGCVLTIADRNVERAEALARRALATGSFSDVQASSGIDGAVAAADVVLTMISFGHPRQTVPSAAFERASLIVAVDYDMCMPAAVVAQARQFLVDDVTQFEATRSGAVFAAYPRADATIGQALGGSAPAPRSTGPMVVNHLGVGLADVVFADAILRRAIDMGLGIELPR
jgi:ornithine cyclodeaminase/alanine dehydrogenase-like protein (mu-crystallin family)